MATGKEFVIQELSDALAVEKAIVENERALAEAVKDTELKQALEEMANEDEGHVANFERVLESLGSPKPVKVEPDDRTVLNALRKVAQRGEEETERLSAHGLLKHKAVEAGEIFHELSQQLGKPKSMQPLEVNLREDRQHAKQLRELTLRIAQERATSGSGLKELQETVEAQA
ncbi:MAG: ferritin-like domain-containing protein [Chloroflexota bacterium]|nr:ferritin-like domain-containing protein [Chloroflexota bacterium]